MRINGIMLHATHSQYTLFSMKIIIIVKNHSEWNDNSLLRDLLKIMFTVLIHMRALWWHSIKWLGGKEWESTKFLYPFKRESKSKSKYKKWIPKPIKQYQIKSYRFLFLLYHLFVICLWMLWRWQLIWWTIIICATIG